MKDRRAFVASMTASALALGTGAAAAAVLNHKQGDGAAFKACPVVDRGPNAEHFPQVVLQDQHKEKAWFYEELVNKKLVMVSFTSTRSEAHYPILDNLVKVQEMIGDRLGKTVHMYTITTTPAQDTPQRLKALAEAHGAGWRFFTGQPQQVREVLRAFNVRGIISGLSWVGNDRTGRWLTQASRQHPLYIAEAIARLSTGKDQKPFLIDLRSTRGAKA